MQLAFDNGEIERIGRAVCAVYLMVSAADGVIDAKELAAFRDYLARTPSQVMSEVMALTEATPGKLMGEIGKMDGTIDELVTEAMVLVERRAPGHALEAFRKAMFDVGLAVARASGGGPLGLGSKISREERRALGRVSRVIGIQLP